MFIREITHFAPRSELHQLGDGRHVIVTVPDGILPTLPDLVQITTELMELVDVVESPTEVFLADEHGTPIDADGDPCNGLTALAQYPTGTTHTQALDLLEGDQ